MGFIKINYRPFGHDAGWVNLGMAFIIMSFDVIKVTSFLNSRQLIEFFEIIPQIGIIYNPA